MNKQEFVKALEKIEIAYTKKFTQEEYSMWFKEFSTTDLKEFENAIKETIRETPYTPRISDIRKRVVVNPNDYYTNDPYAYLYKNFEWCKII